MEQTATSQIVTALQYLAGVCDFAAKLDGSGFNKIDAMFGHELAAQSLNGGLSETQLESALKMLRKYLHQLQEANLSLPESIEPQLQALAKVTQSNGLLWVTFPGIPHPNTRAAMKKIRGWRWNPDVDNKPWSFPATPENAVTLSNLLKISAPSIKSDPVQRPIPQPANTSNSEVTFDYDDGYIIVQFQGWDAFKKYEAAIKSLPERRWDPDRKGKPWIVPVRMLRDLIKAIPDATMTEAVTKIADTQQELSKLSRAATTDFNVQTKLPLLPFQRAGVKFIDTAGGRCIIADSMGLGKTAQYLAYLQLHPENRPAVIVVPASLKINTVREIDKFMTTKERVAILSGTKTHDLELENATIYILNYDILSYWKDRIISLKPAVVIYDEAHLLKNLRAKPKRESTERRGSQRGNAAWDIAQVAPRVICATGTPIVNRPRELFPLLNMADPKAWGSWFRFAQQYCNPTVGWTGGTDYNGASNLEDLHERIKPWFLRRTKEQVLTELPPKRRSTIVVEFDEKAGAEYHMVMNGMKQVIKNSIAEKNPVNVLAQIERAKQAAVAAKMSAVIDWVKDFLNTNGKLVVFCTHQFTVDKLMETFGNVAVKVTGEVTGENRQRAVDEFQKNDKIRLFVGNVKAAGVGLTLTAASDVAFIEFPWTPGDLEQASDRVHRIGQTDSVTVYYLVAENTIEEKICQLLQEKAEIMGQISDGKATNLEINIFDELVKKIS